MRRGPAEGALPGDIIKAAGELMKAEAGVVQAEATCRVNCLKLIGIAGF